MKPFKLAPAFVDYLWGGERLKTEYGKKTEMSPVAESWELSCHPAGQSRAEGGDYAGKTMSEIIELYGRERLLGTNCARFSDFPVLIKLIDAKTPLSLQVHPNDEYAAAHEGCFGKTEMWVVLDSQPGAFLYFGVNREVTREQLRAAIEDGTIESLLGRREVKKGEVLFIPAGELHAIGAGMIICEIQQNSDITYRVYDYNRRDASGNIRELHIEKALDVAHLSPPTERAGGTEAPMITGDAARSLLAKCEYFTARRLTLSGKADFKTYGKSFRCLVCTEGSGALSSMGRLEFSKGDSVFIPADTGAYTLSGRCEGIITTIPEK